MFNISWDNHVEDVASLGEVESLLDRIHRESYGDVAQLVIVERQIDSNSLTIGLGSDISVLSYIPGDANPPYLVSVGELQGEDVIVFRLMGDWSEFPIKNGVPIPVARAAMRYFCKTGILSETVQWEQC
jgi:Immunity protein Imm1